MLETAVKTNGEAKPLVPRNLFLERMPLIDPQNTILEARKSVSENLRRIDMAEGAGLAKDHPGAYFLTDAKRRAAEALLRSYKEIVILLAVEQADPLPHRAMEAIVDNHFYSTDLAAVRAIGKLLSPEAPVVAKIEGRNTDHYVSVCDARSLLDMKLNRIARATGAREDLQGEVRGIVQEGLNLAIDDLRDSFREVAMVLGNDPNDAVGLNALDFLLSKSFILKDKISANALLILMEQAANPQSPGASSASLSAQDPSGL